MWLFSRPLPVGTPAPDFTLKDQSGSPITLSKVRGKSVILVFYPRDETPVCRAQLCELRDSYARLQTENTAVLAINPQKAESHSNFRANNGLPFPLLVDEGSRVAKLYHCDGLVTRRTVYVIDEQGVIRFARRGKPSIEEIMTAA
jgi:peroxiredoxin Q/BCP